MQLMSKLGSAWKLDLRSRLADTLWLERDPLEQLSKLRLDDLEEYLGVANEVLEVLLVALVLPYLDFLRIDQGQLRGVQNRSTAQVATARTRARKQPAGSSHASPSWAHNRDRKSCIAHPQ